MNKSIKKSAAPERSAPDSTSGPVHQGVHNGPSVKPAARPGKPGPLPPGVSDQTQSTSALPQSSFLNRELSWLAFNERVLFEARNLDNPLLERLSYAAICGSNLDEFFMVRVAGIHRQIAANVMTKSLDGLLPKEVLNLVRARTHVMLQGIEKTTREIFKGLQAQGVEIGRVRDLGKRARSALREQYLSQIQPVLTPLIVDPSHPFPYISNLSLNLAVLLEDGSAPDFARVKVPVGVLPRLVKCGDHLLLLEDVIAEHLGELFRGRKVLRSHVFRVTRNTDYEFDEEEAEDLLATIEDGLRRRRFGSAVRLEVTRDMPAEMLDFLRSRLKLEDADVFELQGPLGTANLMGLPVERPDLQFPPYSPRVPDLGGEDDEGMFHTLQQGDVLLHHPYDSFTNVLGFLQAAASDPDVLAIKQTLYRTGDDPRLIGALRTAAENGKQVVALIELKARFDEQRNISSARQLERVGAHVVYGVSGLKTHGKVTLVVRREGEHLRRYVHIGTGNYNPKTARIYTDLSLLSAREELGADVAALFNHLTGYAEADYQHLLVAPDTARQGFLNLLEREAANVAAGQPGWARLKFNQLTDPSMIEALYRASQAGVKIQLMVRGVCCLRPGVPGLSEHIEVRSLIGRFLEHARIYAFAGDAASGPVRGGRSPDVYFGSADWMSRNLDRRVEVIAPVFEDKQKSKLLSLLDTEWADTRGAWALQESGEYLKLSGNSSAQAAFMGLEELPPPQRCRTRCRRRPHPHPTGARYTQGMPVPVPVSVSAAQLRAAALRTLALQPDLQTALTQLGFVQADPIRAPARAQDLTLMQRVSGYRAGDLERLYPELDVEEDVLPNYGFFPRSAQSALHPRGEVKRRIEQQAPGLSSEVLAFVRGHERGEAHPREVQLHFGAARVGNAWGGQSSATTRALESLHHQGLLRVTRRVGGVRLYGPAPHLEALRGAPLAAQERARQVVRLLAALYGPLPQASFSHLLSLSGYGVPDLKTEITTAFKEALQGELHSQVVEGVKYVWLAELPLDGPSSGVRIVGPFDPLVWDRRRFAHLHGWTYKFEAYTPPAKRVLGYYALPLFRGEQAVGWANLKVENGELTSELGFVPGVRQTAALSKGIEVELERYRRFLNLPT